MREKAKLVEMDPDLMNRNLNVGFSGGEKSGTRSSDGPAGTEARDPGRDGQRPGHRCAAHRGRQREQVRSKDNAFIVVTHYQRLLDHIVPDVVHVMANGRIIKSGPKELALELEEKGYDWVKEIA